MLAAALILFFLAVLLVVFALFGGAEPAGFGDFDTTSLVVFLLGMAATLLLVGAAALFRTAGQRAAGRRRDRKKVGELSEKLQQYERGRTDERREQSPPDGAGPRA